MFLNKIPKSFEFVDFYYHNYSVYSDWLINCEICFHNLMTNLTLFSYNYEPVYKFKSLFLGTFAKVSDGWKFYPKFEPYDENENTIFQNKKE